MALTIYGLHLEAVPYFKYPVWVLLELNNDWPEVVHNPRKARSKWSQLSRLLGGGVRLSDVGGVLFSGSSGGTSLWFGDVGYVPMHC